MRARALLLAVVTSLGMALTALAQEATVPATPESTAPRSPETTASGELVPGSAGTVLDGVAIPAGVLGVIEWEESDGLECRRYHGRRSCNGPRRVPLLAGDALLRAEALGVTGHTKVARVAITRAPDDAWVAAAGPPPPSGDLLWPVDGGRFWRGWGSVRSISRTKRGAIRRTGRHRHHEGVDIGAAVGTPILAANDGLVVYSWNGMSGYGNVVAIVHGDASLTLYAHCSATFVVAGQLVRRGQVIAAVGETGLAHGPHLHFELRIAGESHDPEPLFTGRPAHEGTPPEEAEAGGDAEGEDAEAEADGHLEVEAHVHAEDPPAEPAPGPDPDAAPPPP